MFLSFISLAKLMGGAKVLDRCTYKDDSGHETSVWELNDGSTLIIHARSRLVNGNSSPIIEGAQKETNRSYWNVCQRIKRKYAALRKKSKVQLCI